MAHARNIRYAVIEPPPARGRLMWAAACVLASAGVSVAVARHAAALALPPMLSPALWALTCGALLVLLARCVLHRRRSVGLDGDVLVVRAGLNTRRVAASALELERARIIDLDQQRELQPGRRTLGASRPGYHAGWFRTRQWGKGFYLLTERRRVLWLPERAGPHLLLSLHEPQALLAALNAMAPHRGPG